MHFLLKLHFLYYFVLNCALYLEFNEKKVKINNVIYSIEKLKKNFENSKEESKNDILNNKFLQTMFIYNEELKEIFQEYFSTNKYPRLKKDRFTSNNYDNIYMIGNSLKPDGIKTNLEKFLVGDSNNEVLAEGYLLNKRCYFQSLTSSNNYENYKYNNVKHDDTNEIASNNFYTAYFACFFRDNIKEIKRNYPKIYSQIFKILDMKKQNSITSAIFFHQLIFYLQYHILKPLQHQESNLALYLVLQFSNLFQLFLLKFY